MKSRFQRAALLTLSGLAIGLYLFARFRLGAITPVLMLILAALAHLVVLLPLITRFDRFHPASRQLAERLLGVGVGLLVVSLAVRARGWIEAATMADLMVPSAAEMFALAGLMATAGAFIWLRLRRTRRFGRIRTLLDFFILALAMLSLAWLILLEPPFALGMAGFPKILWLGIAPMLDLVLIATLLWLRLTGGLRANRFQSLSLYAWLLLRLSADLAYGVSFLQQQLIRPSFPAIGWLLSAGALWISIDGGALQLEEREDIPANKLSLKGKLGRAMPVIAAYFVVGFTVLDRWASGAFDGFAVIGSSLLLVLILARQGVISGQAEMMQYASLVNSAADLGFVINREGGFILTNPAFQRATGAQLEIGSRGSIWNVVVDHRRVRDALQRANQDGWTGELQFISSDDEPFPVQLSLAPMFDERRGEVVMAGIGHDLTEIKRREQQLRDALAEVDDARADLAQLNVALEKKVSERTSELEQLVSHLEELNEELKELDQLKSEFVTLVSHELRSPLTNIRSGLELTLRRERRAFSKGGTESLDLVLQETDRLTGFVETILDLSALEAGRFPMKIRPVDPRIMVPLVRNRFPSRQADRISFTPPDPTPLVLADEPSLASVLFHLLDNALKYSQGEIEVRVAERGDRIALSVLDTGPGIPAQSREAIFDRFHRLDYSDSREIYGHGLGLYLCRRLTEAMRGTVSLSDDHSPGACFEVILPSANAAGPTTPGVDHDRGKSTQGSKSG